MNRRSLFWHVGFDTESVYENLYYKGVKMSDETYRRLRSLEKSGIFNLVLSREATIDYHPHIIFENHEPIVVST